MVEQGYAVEMVDGRRRYLHGEKERHTTFCNNTVQGSCASVMKLAMYGIHQQLKDIDPAAKLVAQIHDELLIEVAEDKADAVLAMAESVMVSAGQEIFGDGIEMVAEGGIGDPGEPLSNGSVLTECRSVLSAGAGRVASF